MKELYAEKSRLKRRIAYHRSKGSWWLYTKLERELARVRRHLKARRRG